MVQISQEVIKNHPNPPQSQEKCTCHNVNNAKALDPPVWPLLHFVSYPFLQIDIEKGISSKEWSKWDMNWTICIQILQSSKQQHQGSTTSSLTSLALCLFSFSPNWYWKGVFTARKVQIGQEMTELHRFLPMWVQCEYKMGKGKRRLCKFFVSHQCYLCLGYDNLSLLCLFLRVGK